MKITRRQLRRLIKEELSLFGEAIQGSVPREPDLKGDLEIPVGSELMYIGPIGNQRGYEVISDVGHPEGAGGQVGWIEPDHAPTEVAVLSKNNTVTLTEPVTLHDVVVGVTAQ